MTEQSLVFVAGALRSGSTLLHLMLDSHPQIANPGEFDFFFDKVSDQGDLPDLDAYHSWLHTSRIFQSKKLHINRNTEFPNLINNFVDQLKGEECALALNVHRNFHRIPMLFPSAKFIHLIRDPRDVAMSSIGMGWVGSTYYGVDHWIDTELSWDRLVRNLKPQQYMELKYEKLLESTEGSLREICSFIGVEYSERMLDYPSHSTYSAPDKSLMYQWRRKLDDRNIRILETKLGKWLSDRKYEVSGFDPLTLSTVERGWFFCQNKVFRAKIAVQRYGLPLFLLEKLTRYIDLFSVHEKLCQKINDIDATRVK